MLRKGDANLPSKCLTRCTHVMVIDKSRLDKKIGTLTKDKLQDIINHIIWMIGRGGVILDATNDKS